MEVLTSLTFQNPSWSPNDSSLDASGLLIKIVGGLAAFFLGVYVYCWPLREYRLPYRNIPGPPPANWFIGVMRLIITSPPQEPHRRWMATYGPTIRLPIYFGLSRLTTTDPAALSYILSHPDAFPKPALTRRVLRMMLGNGLLVAEGHDHRKQRKALNPIFSVGAIKGMVPVFYDKAYELREKLLALVEGDWEEEASPTPEKKEDKVPGGRKVDVLKYLGNASLDIIGIAGFSYDFKSLSEQDNELSKAYREMFAAGSERGIFARLQLLLPALQIIPTRMTTMLKRNQEVTRRIGMRLIEDKKRAVASEHSEGLEKKENIGNDLLSILIKANMASDVAPEQRLSDEEVLDQITTFMLAGNETSSTALTWILYTLSQHPDAQVRLREELLTVASDRPSLEKLNSLPYLDAVIREVLRLSSPAPSTIREATGEYVIPLSIPVVGRDGKLVESVHVKKGTKIFIPILSVNTSPAIWGPDAAQFNPHRFISGDVSAAQALPGTWGNIMSFLGGARNCIGYRFALAEIKVILFVLLRGFEFAELKSKPDIERRLQVVMRPRVKGEEKAGLQMPLMVTPLSA
ncbi:hypothetical protein IAT38_008202 [Cryptococcus sp. DSM 104549]